MASSPPVPSPPPPPPLPPAPTPYTFTFSLDNVDITNTRSRDEDTDYSSCYGKVNNVTVAAMTQSNGDKNNGNFAPGPNGGALICSFKALPTDTVEMGFQIINSGNSGSIASIIEGGITVLGGILSATGNAWAGFASAVANGIVGILFADCDGAVAADKVTAALASSLGGVVFADKSYPGSDSPTGCGSNSEYYVTWHYTRA